MGVGPRIRSAFGRYEPAVAELYRRIFIDLEHFASQVRTWAPNANSILEVGCGEGAVTERLQQIFLEAEITAIDVTPRVGRLFRGDRNHVHFAQKTIEEISVERPGEFDLIILCDVIHHVPEDIRASLLSAVSASLAPNGRFIFKDWARNATPIHWLCHAADRWITGDQVSYLDCDEAEQMISSAFPGSGVVERTWVRPWKNNFMFLIERYES